MKSWICQILPVYFNSQNSFSCVFEEKKDEILKIRFHVFMKIKEVESFMQYKYKTLNETRGPKGPWVAHLRKRSKITVEPFTEYH